MLHRSKFVPGLGAVLLAVVVSACADSDHNNGDVVVSVTGEGVVHAEPDLAVISANLTRQGPDSTKLLDSVNRDMATVVQVLKDFGIADSDIQAGQLHINQRWRRHDGHNQPAGYQAQRPINIKVKQLESYPELISLISRAGVNTLSSIAFDFSNRVVLSDQALVKAAEDASRKAGVLAKALDLDDCEPQQLSIGSRHVPMPRMEMAALKAGGDSFNPGAQEITATVTGNFLCR